MLSTAIHRLDTFCNNYIYVKREDLIPYSFGGNKARKAELFFREIDKGNYDCVVTYGSSHSNHCRVVSNMAVARHIPCYIVAPSEVADRTNNSRFMELFGAEIITIPVSEVKKTIEEKMESLKNEGKMPYFIPGGGHGNIGTQAYVDCYNEIVDFEKNNDIFFDYIFFASGTGTTHAGLVCGQLIAGHNRRSIGISIAREKNRGRNVIIESIKDYFKEKQYLFSLEEIENNTHFIDDYIGDGYGKTNEEIEKLIKMSMKDYGMPLDSTYTAKAFYGMQKYLEKENVVNKNILFIHTGGTPLFFDDLNEMM